MLSGYVILLANVCFTWNMNNKKHRISFLQAYFQPSIVVKITLNAFVFVDGTLNTKFAEHNIFLYMFVCDMVLCGVDCGGGGCRRVLLQSMAVVLDSKWTIAAPTEFGNNTEYGDRRCNAFYYIWIILCVDVFNLFYVENGIKKTNF